MFPYNNSLDIINCSYGMVFFAQRLRDRMFRKKLLNFWYTLTCQRKKCILIEPKAEEQVNSLLNTRLNTDLILVILKGITLMNSVSSDNKDYSDSMTKRDLLKMDHTSRIHLKDIVIEEASLFHSVDQL